MDPVVFEFNVRTPPPLNRTEPNASMAGVGGYWLVPAADIPTAAAWAKQLAPLIPPGVLQPHSWVEVLTLSKPSELALQAQSPSGQVHRYRGRNLVLDVDCQQAFCRIYAWGEVCPQQTLIPVPGPLCVPRWRESPLGPLLPQAPRLFVGGLISLSAEPPEGFFAAATEVEFKQAGWPLAQAEEAQVWLYRVPDSRVSSYFQLYYPTPRRPREGSREGKFLIASSLGPANEPTSAGGREADLLWLGDEQHGPLLAYLQTLARNDLTLSHFRAHQGLMQKLPGGRVLLCQADRRWALSKQGFNQLSSEPAHYRQVFSQEYDNYLRSLFQPCPPAAASYLLATSRGCTQGCAICCSGGLSAFQSFSASRMMEELNKIAADAGDCGAAAIDVFFLDSNFNNHPDRLIELAQLYSQSPLQGRFRFFVRHNTVNGFLQGHGSAPKEPNRALIEAFRQLGIQEIFMGVDTFDDNSTLTLKSNRLHLAKKGIQARPTYRVEELRALLAALDESGARVKAFYLQNNPWVTDLDRIDSYYNIAELWLRYPRFSIDARQRDVNRLKPFAGSPIERISRSSPELTHEGRYVARGVLGEIDEWMDATIFGRPQIDADRSHTLEVFAHDRARLQRAAEQRYQQLGCPDSARILAKIKARDQQLLTFLEDGPLAQEIRAFASRWAHLASLDAQQQARLFEQAARPLLEGLQQLQPRRRPALPTEVNRPMVALFPIHLLSKGYRARGRAHRNHPQEMQKSS
jgi:hypothetical protein